MQDRDLLTAQNVKYIGKYLPFSEGGLIQLWSLPVPTAQTYDREKGTPSYIHFCLCRSVWVLENGNHKRNLSLDMYLLRLRYIGHLSVYLD